jgi:chromosome segregation ATPase
MTTAIEDSELNTELQELYLEAKQWITDLDFLDSELSFLKKLTANLSAQADQKQEVEKLTGLEKTYYDLKNEMHNYLHQLEPLIAEKK